MSPIRLVLRDVPAYRQLKLMGNSMHLVTQFAWLAYCLAHVQPLPRYVPLLSIAPMLVPKKRSASTSASRRSKKQRRAP